MTFRRSCQLSFRDDQVKNTDRSDVTRAYPTQGRPELPAARRTHSFSHSPCFNHILPVSTSRYPTGPPDTRQDLLIPDRKDQRRRRRTRDGEEGQGGGNGEQGGGNGEQGSGIYSPYTPGDCTVPLYTPLYTTLGTPAPPGLLRHGPRCHGCQCRIGLWALVLGLRLGEVTLTLLPSQSCYIRTVISAQLPVSVEKDIGKIGCHAGS